MADNASADTGTLHSWSLIVTPKAFSCTSGAIYRYVIADDKTGRLLLFNLGGDFTLIDCRKGVTLATGTGAVQLSDPFTQPPPGTSCKIVLVAGSGKNATVSINATANLCTKVGDATATVAGVTYTLHDSNISNSSFTCGAVVAPPASGDEQRLAPGATGRGLR